jgi:hypothetical protein
LRAELPDDLIRLRQRMAAALNAGSWNRLSERRLPEAICLILPTNLVGCAPLSLLPIWSRRSWVAAVEGNATGKGRLADLHELFGHTTTIVSR